MSSISSVKNLPANAIKILAVILNLASDKPDSDKKPEKINISLLSDCCLWTLRDHKTNRDKSRETSLNSWLQKKKWLAQTWLCLWPCLIYQYSDMAPRLSGQKWIFLSFFCFSIPKRDLNTKKKPLNIEVCPERLRSILAYWFIERGVLVFVLDDFCFEWLRARLLLIMVNRGEWLWNYTIQSFFSLFWALTVHKTQ